MDNKTKEKGAKEKEKKRDRLTKLSRETRRFACPPRETLKEKKQKRKKNKDEKKNRET